MRKIKRGDTVKVISGDNKNKIGSVLSVYSKCHKYKSNVIKYFIVVKGVNFRKVKDKSKASQLSNKPVFVEKEQGIDISNVAFYSSSNESVEKIGFRYGVDGKKERYFKSNSQSV